MIHSQKGNQQRRDMSHSSKEQNRHDVLNVEIDLITTFDSVREKVQPNERVEPLNLK